MSSKQNLKKSKKPSRKAVALVKKKRSQNERSKSKKLNPSKSGVSISLNKSPLKLLYKSSWMVAVKLFLRRLILWCKKERDAYPVAAFSIIPILFFWSKSNIQELGPSMMVRPLLAAMILSLAYYALLYRLLGRNKYKASILSVIAVIIFFNYAQIFVQYQKLISFILDIKIKVQSQALFIFLIAIFYAACIHLVRKKIRNTSKVTRDYLAILATLLIFLNAYPLVKYWSSNSGLNKISIGSDIVTDADVKDKPDIYFIMPEDYGSHRTLKKYYNYEDNALINKLEDKGFYVAPNSVANYPFTTFSIATTMNLDYIPEVLRNKEESTLYYNLLKNKIEDNKAAFFLKDQGYEFINLGSWWTATKYNKNADLDLYKRTGVNVLGKTVDLKEHELLLLQDSMAWPLFNGRLGIGGKTLLGLSFPEGDSSSRAIQKQSFVHQLDTLKELVKRPGPKYVFAHFLLPHGPYVYDENCNPTKQNKEEESVNFIKQTECVGKKLSETIDYILKNSKTKPIIMLQTDEGPYPKEFREDEYLDWTKAPVDLLHQKADILNAYYFPDGDYSDLYKNISPVNSFRVIFNKYFGTKLDILEDRVYFQESEQRRFFLNDLTDRFKF